MMNKKQKEILIKAIKQFPFELQDPSRGETDEPTSSTTKGVYKEEFMFYAGGILGEAIIATGYLHMTTENDEVRIWA